MSRRTGGDTVRVRGLSVSSCERTFVELGTALGLVDLVVVGDRLVRKQMTSLATLQRYVTGSSLPGAARARQAIGFVRERVDSVMETKVRMLIVLAGLPEPEVNLKIRAWDGAVLRSYDLSYRSIRLIVEYDGRQHVEIIENWEKDLKRREAIEDDQWRIIVLVASDIYRTPGDTVDRIWRALRAKGMPGVPARPGDAWRAHFPGH